MDETSKEDRDGKQCPECEEPASPGTFCFSCGHYYLATETRSSIEPPPNLIKDVARERYVLTRRWKKGWFKGAPFIILFFGCFLLFVNFFDSESFQQKVASLGFGVLMSGMAVVLLVNSTRVEISPDFLSVKKGPVPIPLARSFTLRRDEIAKVTLTKNKSHGDGRKSGYDLKAVKVSGEPFDVVQLTDSGEAILLLGFIRKKMNLSA